MGHPIMFTTTSHVITLDSLVTVHAPVSLLRISVKSFVSAVQNVSKNLSTFNSNLKKSDCLYGSVEF